MPTPPSTTTTPTTTTASPQFQESLLESRTSPNHQRQHMPHKNPSSWINESTALYNLNQGLAVSFTFSY